ncbi:uncharacterized protein DUF2726 [Nitrosomonas aestuarii]|nr:uncharacterized protein DUF2726 [Nitrosomonas aestuarii]
MDVLDLILNHLTHDFLMVFIATFLLFSFFSVYIKSKRKENSEFTYCALPNLFTPAELSFYFVIKQAVSDSFDVFGKVRIADVISPDKEMNRKKWQSAFNRISSKHFDYVICDPNTLTVVAVIELDDKSHNLRKSVSRDLLINDVCKSANIKLIRFEAKSTYQIAFVREAINDVLNAHQ